MVVLIVYDYANKMKLIYYYLLVNCTIERQINDFTLLDSGTVPPPLGPCDATALA